MNKINKLEIVNYVSQTIKNLNRMLNKYYGFMFQKTECETVILKK